MKFDSISFKYLRIAVLLSAAITVVQVSAITFMKFLNAFQSDMTALNLGVQLCSIAGALVFYTYYFIRINLFKKYIVGKSFSCAIVVVFVLSNITKYIDIFSSIGTETNINCAVSGRQDWTLEFSCIRNAFFANLDFQLNLWLYPLSIIILIAVIGKGLPITKN